MDAAFVPEPAAPARFNTKLNAWVFTRFADVAAAFREPALRQGRAGDDAVPGDPAERHAEVLASVQNDVARMSTPAWRTAMEDSLRSLLENHRGRNCDLVRDILHPLTVTLLLRSSGAPASLADELSHLASALFLIAIETDTSTDPSVRKAAKQRHKQADAALDALLLASPVVGKPMFAGFTQTLTSFLAKAWLALLEHPEQCVLLRESREALSTATEELLRFAGVVHTIHRTAITDISIRTANIRAGQSVALRVSAANFDPERFPHPDRLDLLRRSPGHLGLGAGLHNCVGAFLIRLATITLAPLMAASEVARDPSVPVEWTRDSALLWPHRIPVRMRV